MARLLIHVEGHTEKEFVDQILRDHLVAKGYHSVSARFVGNARQRGGIRNWPAARKGILNHLREDPGCIVATMVDYYALPQRETDGWPGRARAATRQNASDKGRCVQEAMKADLAGEFTGPSRFVPFILMHEFEGLLFSDCERLSEAIGNPDLEAAFRRIRDQFPTPEDIDDAPRTAPSKRILDLAPRYQKPLLGVRALQATGLAAVRAACPHFDAWLRALEEVVP
jgi:uncharacterized protein DUF4276